MIEFTPIENGTFWSGANWTVIDDEVIAQLVARVALGQSRHVIRILQETDCAAYAPASTTVDGAIQLLTATDPHKPWHRDGWLFQTICWIGANIQNPETLKAPPHMIHAHKGFDGIQLYLDESNENVAYVVIHEQKATESPRKMIRDQVWPEFMVLESGRRDNELIAEVTTLLERHHHVNPDMAVSKILWEKSRAYCVTVTIGDENSSKPGRKSLFKGYKKAVPSGTEKRRRAETVYQKKMRSWMRSLADKAIGYVKEVGDEHV